MCFNEVKCKEEKLLKSSKRFPKPEPHLWANNSPSGGYNRCSLESMTLRRADCLCAAKTLFDLGGVGNPPSCSELDDGPESRDGEREEPGLQNRE